MHATSALAADEIAEFLQQNPDFFDTHADVFSTLSVPHPYQGRVVSLAERQIVTLRERTHVLECRLATLAANAKESERIVAGIHEWSLQLLATAEATALPRLVIEGLVQQFALSAATLRVWQDGCMFDSEWRQPVSRETIELAEKLVAPRCGDDARLEPATWLATAPASHALLPLRIPQQGRTFGLLVLGSDDAQRFTPEVGTEFLAQIGNIAGAALSRLL